MSKGSSIKEALAKFEEKNGCKANEEEKVSLIAQIPPIEKMDASLSTLSNCKQLSLSTNCIEKIANLNGLKNLKILSLGRNNIKSFTGLEAVGDTLEELWISYNLIEKLKGINVLRKLKVLYMVHNKVSDWSEFNKLADLECLTSLTFNGNPLQVGMANNMDEYKATVRTKLKKLEQLDGEPVLRMEEMKQD